MVNIDKVFGNDAKRELEGVWFEYVSVEGTIRIKCARPGGANKAYQKRIDKLLEPHLPVLRANKMPSDLLQKISRQAFAETCPIEWEGIERPGPDGILLAVKLTAENVLKVFEDLPDLADWLM